MKAIKFINVNFLLILSLSFLNTNYAERYESINANAPTYYAAYPSKGFPYIVHWTSSTISWYLNSQGAPSNDGFNFNSTKLLLDASFVAWQNISTSNVTFSYSDSTGDMYGYDNKNVLSWVYAGDPLYDIGNPFDPDTALGHKPASAITILTCNGNYELLDVDIAFNGEKVWYDNGYNWNDVQSVAIHEIGHFMLYPEI